MPQLPSPGTRMGSQSIPAACIKPIYSKLWSIRTRFAFGCDLFGVCKNKQWRLQLMSTAAGGINLKRLAYKKYAVNYSCAQNYSTPLAFPYDFYRDKSRNIDCCVNSMLPINQNMIVSQGLELILSMFRRNTMSGQHPFI